jgi:hypothetical protein
VQLGLVSCGSSGAIQRLLKSPRATRKAFVSIPGGKGCDPRRGATSRARCQVRAGSGLGGKGRSVPLSSGLVS